VTVIEAHVASRCIEICRAHNIEIVDAYGAGIGDVIEHAVLDYGGVVHLVRPYRFQPLTANGPLDGFRPHCFWNLPRRIRQGDKDVCAANQRGFLLEVHPRAGIN